MTQSNGLMILEDIFIYLPASPVETGTPEDAAVGTSANPAGGVELATAPATRLHVHLSTDGSASVRWPDDDARQAEARSVLSVPIRLRAGAVGAVHLVGPRAGEFIPEDGDHLRTFAQDVGAAYDRFLRRERAGATPGGGLRILLGVAAMVVGLVLVLAAAWALEARALPLSRLAGRPGVWPGVALTAIGLLVARRRRGRIVV